MLTLIATLLSIAFLFYHHLKNKNLKKFNPKNHPLNLLSVLGSGGHTNEMLRLLKNLPYPKMEKFDKFETKSKNVYSVNFILADTDYHSFEKAEKFFNELDGKEAGEFINLAGIHKIPRSREVGQSYISSLLTTVLALYRSFKEFIFVLQ